MHGFPEWFMILMTLLTSRVFWIVVLIVFVLFTVWVFRKIKQKLFSKDTVNHG